jgi:glycosyltransferase involved in cell wall biosynthesis
MSRFLFVFDIGFDRPGPSVHLLNDIMRSALLHGHDIDVLSKDTGGTESLIAKEVMADPRFHHFIVKDDDEKKYGNIKRYLNEIKYASHCADIYLKQDKYGAAFLQSNPTAYFYFRDLKKLGCPVIYNVQDIFPYNLRIVGQSFVNKLLFPIFRRLQHSAYHKAAMVITISDDMKRQLIDDGVDPEKIRVIYNWSYSDEPIVLGNIPKERFFDLHCDKAKTNAVYAGNIGRMQNVEIIAETAKLTHEDDSIHYYIIGEGVNKPRIVSEIADMNNVTILPMQPASFAESIYAQADINIIPLRKKIIYTCLPSKIPTVLRANKPMIFCLDKDSLFGRCMSEKTNSVVVSPDDAGELAAAIREFQHHKVNHSDLIDLSLFSQKNANDYIESLEGLCQTE